MVVVTAIGRGAIAIGSGGEDTQVRWGIGVPMGRTDVVASSKR